MRPVAYFVQLLAFSLSLSGGSPRARADQPLCRRWSSPVTAGKLDHKLIAESSGLAASRRFKERLYHINDSGDGAAFYITDSRGRDPKRIAVTGGFAPMDAEDLALGPCGDDEKSCLFIGDIGDNAE